MNAGSPPLARRRQAEARRVLNEHFPFKCCAVCGLQLPTCLTVAHLDHDAGDNSPDNLARLRQTHHWIYDAGMYPKATHEISPINPHVGNRPLALRPPRRPW